MTKHTALGGNTLDAIRLHDFRLLRGVGEDVRVQPVALPRQVPGGSGGAVGVDAHSLGGVFARAGAAAWLPARPNASCGLRGRGALTGPGWHAVRPLLRHRPPTDLRIDWRCYNYAEHDDQKLVDFICWYGDPFPLEEPLSPAPPGSRRRKSTAVSLWSRLGRKSMNIKVRGGATWCSAVCDA